MKYLKKKIKEKKIRTPPPPCCTSAYLLKTYRLEVWRRSQEISVFLRDDNDTLGSGEQEQSVSAEQQQRWEGVSTALLGQC